MIKFRQWHNSDLFHRHIAGSLKDGDRMIIRVESHEREFDAARDAPVIHLRDERRTQRREGQCTASERLVVLTYIDVQPIHDLHILRDNICRNERGGGIEEAHARNDPDRKLLLLRRVENQARRRFADPWVARHRIHDVMPLGLRLTRRIDHPPGDRLIQL